MTRDVLLTLIGATVGSNQVQIDHFWFKVEGPVSKEVITDGIKQYVASKLKKENKVMNRDGITVYNVFVAENEG